jgi:hypothetical protein
MVELEEDSDEDLENKSVIKSVKVMLWIASKV